MVRDMETTPQKTTERKAHGDFCRYSPWTAPFFDNLFRKIFQDPEKIVGPHIRPGMTVMDIGCGLGFFTLAMARMAGPGKGDRHRYAAGDARSGEKEKRPAGLSDRIRSPVQAGLAGYHGKGRVHPVLLYGARSPRPGCTVPGSKRSSGTGGRYLIVEPAIHVSGEHLRIRSGHAEKAGFVVEKRPKISLSRAALLKKA